jgi:hypothetical protein
MMHENGFVHRGLQPKVSKPRLYQFIETLLIIIRISWWWPNLQTGLSKSQTLALANSAKRVLLQYKLCIVAQLGLPHLKLLVF